MQLLVGLGNPGPKYERNRHNIGFMAVDEIVRRHGFSGWRARFQGQTAEGEIGGVRVLALKPATFMNESGRAVGEALRFFKLQAEQVAVVHDELDLAPGRLKIKQGGGHGGHNGLRSVDAHIGRDYWRIRLGIGHPGDKAKVHGYVLSDFGKAEWADAERLIETVAETAPLFYERGPAEFMSRAALLLNPPADRTARARKAESGAPSGETGQADAVDGAGGAKGALAAALAKARRFLKEG